MLPFVTLVDAREAGVDEAGLRRMTRLLSSRRAAPFTSRSYRYPYALVVCYSAPVGVDIERIVRHSSELASVLCTPDEATWLATVPDPDRALTDLWSSKEALAKALGDARVYEPRWLPAPRTWPEGRSGPWVAGRLEAPGGHVAWLCWRAAGQPAPPAPAPSAYSAWSGGRTTPDSSGSSNTGSARSGTGSRIRGGKP